MSFTFGGTRFQDDPAAGLKSIGSEHLRDRLILPAHLSPTIFGGSGVITAIDPDDPVLAGATGLLADAGHQHPAITGAPATLTRTETNAESAGTGLARDVHVHATTNLAWGTLKSQVLTSNNASTVSYTSDFALSSVAVLNTRDYEICLSSLVSRSANSDWQINVHIGGTLLNEIGRAGDNAVGVNKNRMGILYKPGSSATVNIDIRVVLVSGGGTFSFLGGTNAERHFWIEDKGPRT